MYGEIKVLKFHEINILYINVYWFNSWIREMFIANKRMNTKATA